MKKIIVAVAVIAATIVALPLVGGKKAQTELNELVTMIDDSPGYQASWVTYQKNWLTTDATLHIVFTSALDAGEEPESVDLPLTLAIAHGPILFGHTPSVGWFDFNVQLTEEQSGYLSEHVEKTGSGELLQIRGYMNLAGVLTLENKILPFTATDDDFNLTFDGYQGWGSLHPSGEFRYTGELGQWSLEAEDVAMNAAASTLELESDYSKIVRGTNLMPSHLDYQLPSATLKVDDETMTMEKMSLVGNVSLPEEQPVVDMFFSLGFKKGQIDDQTVENFELEFSYDRISLELVKQYMKLANDMLENPGVEPDPAAYFSNEVVAEALTYKPGLSLNKMNMVLPEGKLKSALSLSMEPVDGVDPTALMANPLAALNGLLMDLHVTMDKPLAKKMAEAQAEKSITAQMEAEKDAGVVGNYTDQQITDMISQEAEMMLQMMVLQGVVVETEDQYTCDFKLHKGETIVNGKPMPLPLGALLGAGM